ncbi:MAG: helix-turn-helix transcriptional regulator [Azospirillaceae bacterium]
MTITLILEEAERQIGDRVRLIAASEGWPVIDLGDAREETLPGHPAIAVFATERPAEAAARSRRALAMGARASLALVPEALHGLAVQLEGIAYDRVLVADELPALGETLSRAVAELRDFRDPGDDASERARLRFGRPGLYALDPVACRAFGAGWTLALDEDETRLLLCLAGIEGDTVGDRELGAFRQYGFTGGRPLTRDLLEALNRRFLAVGARLVDGGDDERPVLADGRRRADTAKPASAGAFVDLADGLNRRIGLRVKQCRRAIGFSRPDLASRIGLSTQVITNLERGTTEFDVERLTRVAAGLNLSVGDLLVDFLGDTVGARSAGAASPPTALFQRIDRLPDGRVATILRQLVQSVN